MSEILNPKTEVKLGNHTVTVRELAWPDAMEFLERLGAHIGQLANEEGQIEFDQKDLPRLITGSRELAEMLVLKSTAKDSAWLAERSPLEVLTLLDEAIPLNLSPQLMQLGKQVAGRVQVALGIAPPPATSAA